MTFRFAVVAGRASSGAEWTATARRAEELGYDTLLTPDTLNTYAPFPALAAAAAVTTRLRVGTYVLSAPNRPPGLVAYETESLQQLSDGRFELGIGGGRPGAERDAEALGSAFGSPAERLALVERLIELVRANEHPPRVLVAASKPRMLRLAARLADTIALGLPPAATEEELARTVSDLREFAGDRFDELELKTNIAGIAPSPSELPPWLSRLTGGGDPAAMAESGSLVFLTGSAEQIADLLRHRREKYAVSYIGMNAMFMEEFAPVIKLLRSA
ncbi:LLM class flavin-dependent oxidoreductase [Actinoplanes sp. TBRC 11911]|uniref:LLM class flavin-dependent oxidoreductase n=1 Tax=Actinoplanes sp. TBRC 11911 TaxID=2729386 RepID=UPI00145FA96B|nr:LLM class flavin-dependent oxidoreductase [Actinoplanes sp. TBRC 11911]NMO53259.1 LLM class flavin-dependent oxidoreductase [Actinoplanes sp. TBRC 11911]